MQYVQRGLQSRKVITRKEAEAGRGPGMEHRSSSSLDSWGSVLVMKPAQKLSEGQEKEQALGEQPWEPALEDLAEQRTGQTAHLKEILLQMEYTHSPPKSMYRREQISLSLVTELKTSSLQTETLFLLLKTIFLLNSGVFADTIGPMEEDSNLVKKEADVVTLKCSYESTSSNIWLYWYRQRVNVAPEYLLYQGAKSRSSEKSTPTDTRLKATTTDTSTELKISGLKLTDSALYYCVLRVDPVIQSP
ncbi:uncharacterized protein LOC118803374 [Colossoma macropomum]|uniref:uncharacterized protein LOC118803374 n=1 Tax=Colossoma macropomum TaxID=42526 RepID=UPI00186429A0|nr:uncharacterized protein LOC118803374 [Colossoma macropomum]